MLFGTDIHHYTSVASQVCPLSLMLTLFRIKQQEQNELMLNQGENVSVTQHSGSTREGQSSE